MSFNRLNYDTCSYKQVLEESIGPGEYRLATPHVSCDPCFNKDPRFRLQQNGVSLNTKMNMIDTDSELLNITRDASSCSKKKFNPEFNKAGNIQNPSDMLHLTECKNLTTEDTRLSNPPATLRGTGWNRWEWLCQNPQDQVFRPYEWNTNTKLVAKDNYRPCVPRPFDQTVGLPRTNPNLTMDLHPTCGNNTATPAQGWSFCPALNN